MGVNNNCKQKGRCNNRRMTGNINIYICSETCEKDGSSNLDESESNVSVVTSVDSGKKNYITKSTSTPAIIAPKRSSFEAQGHDNRDEFQKELMAKVDNREKELIAKVDNREKELMAKVDNREKELMAKVDNNEKELMTKVDNRERMISITDYNDHENNAMKRQSAESGQDKHVSYDENLDKACTCSRDKKCIGKCTCGCKKSKFKDTKTVSPKVKTKEKNIDTEKVKDTKTVSPKVKTKEKIRDTEKVKDTKTVSSKDKRKEKNRDTEQVKDTKTVSPKVKKKEKNRDTEQIGFFSKLINIMTCKKSRRKSKKCDPKCTGLNRGKSKKSGIVKSRRSNINDKVLNKNSLYKSKMQVSKKCATKDSKNKVLRETKTRIIKEPCTSPTKGEPVKTVQFKNPVLENEQRAQNCFESPRCCCDEIKNMCCCPENSSKRIGNVDNFTNTPQKRKKFCSSCLCSDCVCKDKSSESLRCTCPSGNFTINPEKKEEKQRKINDLVKCKLIQDKSCCPEIKEKCLCDLGRNKTKERDKPNNATNSFCSKQIQSKPCSLNPLECTCNKLR